MRTHRHPELRREQKDRDVLVHPTDSAGVDLHHVDRVRLQQLLEHHRVLHMLPGGHLDRCDGATHRGVAEHVVGRGRLLDPVRVVRAQLLHPLDRLPDAPDLVGVDRHRHVRAHRVAGDGQPPDVVGEVRADLQFDQAEAVRHGLPGEPCQLLIVVAQPTRR